MLALRRWRGRISVSPFRQTVRGWPSSHEDPTDAHSWRHGVSKRRSSPFFSPDGAWIGFGAGGQLKKVSVEGGAAVVLCDAPGLLGASWGDDQQIVFTPGGTTALVRVAASGG